MKNRSILVLIILLLSLSISYSQEQSTTEHKVDLNDFYKPFSLEDITQKNMQKWPYYRYTSMNWDDYGIFGTVDIMKANEPTILKTTENQFDIQQELSEGRTFVESLTATQTKGFMILKDNTILAEFYDNGFSQNQTQLLQSSSKTFAGIIVSKLIDDNKIDSENTVDSYLLDFKGTALGKAKIQHVLDMQAGLLPATDYHVPGGEAYEFEIEQGLKPGNPKGHRKAVREAEIQNAPGEVYNYNDKNTDLLAMLAESVSGKSFNKLLSDLFNDFGATSNGSIALTVDGTASPAYGISCTLRDYALFHQWIAQGKAPDSFYKSVEDVNKDLLQETELGKGLAAGIGTTVTYASQAWYFPEHKVISSAGSYGQYGYSDMKSGLTIVFMQDWEDNAVAEKYVEMVSRAMYIIEKYSKK